MEACDSEELLAAPSLDVFLLGLVFFEGMVGRRMFVDYNDAVRKAEAPGEFQIGTERLHDQVAKYLLENMLCKDPVDRFTTRDLAVNLEQVSSTYLCMPSTSRSGFSRISDHSPLPPKP